MRSDRIGGLSAVLPGAQSTAPRKPDRNSLPSGFFYRRRVCDSSRARRQIVRGAGHPEDGRRWVRVASDKLKNRWTRPFVEMSHPSMVAILISAEALLIPARLAAMVRAAIALARVNFCMCAAEPLPTSLPVGSRDDSKTSTDTRLPG
jgi:hypothetical protein